MTCFFIYFSESFLSFKNLDFSKTSLKGLAGMGGEIFVISTLLHKLITFRVG